MANSWEISELNVRINADIKVVSYNEHNIDIKQYLPVNEKLDLISWAITQSADDLKFYNVGKLEVFKTIGIIQKYTNIEITDADLLDSAHLYDLLISSGLVDAVIAAIPESELIWINTVLQDTVKSIYQYQNSVMGILDAVNTDYENLNFDVEQLQKNIADPNNLALLKDVVDKLG